MADDADETVDSTNNTTEEVDNTEEVDETDYQSGSEDLTALQEKNKRLFERAKKAEAEAKLLKAERLKKEEQAKANVETKTSEKQDVYSQEDVAVLVSKVTDKEDREFVKKSAKTLGISLEDALNDPIVSGKLKERAEQRATAQATNTGAARRGSGKPTNEQILDNATQGKFPEDAEELAEARFAAKKSKNSLF